jgi:ABC-2 type transport system ATP-binding protein
LSVWSVQGEGAARWVEPLKAAPGVLSVAAFGNAVHVAGQDAERVAQALAPLHAQPGLRVTPADASLEDVFISLIGRAQDNFGKSLP